MAALGSSGAGRFGQRQRIGRDEAREIIDMAVGVVVQQAIAEPQHPVETEIARQPRFDIGPGKVTDCDWG